MKINACSSMESDRDVLYARGGAMLRAVTEPWRECQYVGDCLVGRLSVGSLADSELPVVKPSSVMSYLGDGM